MQTVESLKICTLIGSFGRSKAYKIRWKNTELCFLALKSDARFKEKLTLSSRNGIRNLANFHRTIQEFKNFGQVENSETSETSETLEIFFRLFLFRLFHFDPLLKIETRKKKTRKKSSEVSDVSEFSICHFLDVLIKCHRFKF